MLVSFFLTTGPATCLSRDTGEFSVIFRDQADPAVFREYDAHIALYLLDDNDDTFTQIEALREQSKAELEPVIKQYMLTVEALNQVASQKKKGLNPEKDRLLSTFKVIEEQVGLILEEYKERIDKLIQGHILQTIRMKFPVSEPLWFKELFPGKYRVYGELTFSTTRLRWFEPLIIRGGDSYTIIFTRQNMQNPYWTELNWWSFMNLDFSKHH